MLTDIEGSTAMWDAQPDAMGDALTRHEVLIADVVENHRGRLIKSAGEGDATLSVFVRATDGVLAALELQRVLGAEPWPGDLDVRVRVALHTGEAQLRDGDYFGTTVNRAARVRGLAVGGQVLLSQATYQLVADQLPTDVSVNDLGRHELKGLSRDEQVFGLVHPDLAVIGAAQARAHPPCSSRGQATSGLRCRRSWVAPRRSLSVWTFSNNSGW